MPEEDVSGFVIEFPNGYAVSVAFNNGDSIARTTVSHTMPGSVRIVPLAGREVVQYDSEEGVAELIMRVACLPSIEMENV